MSHECPFEGLREGYRKDTKRARGRPDRNVASCSRPTTTVIAPLHECKKVWHAQKPYPAQTVEHESSKVGRRGKREEERLERQRSGGWWKERQPNKTKHIRGTKTRPTNLGTG